MKLRGGLPTPWDSKMLNFHLNKRKKKRSPSPPMNPSLPTPWEKPNFTYVTKYVVALYITFWFMLKLPKSIFSTFFIIFLPCKIIFEVPWKIQYFAYASVLGLDFGYPNPSIIFTYAFLKIILKNWNIEWKVQPSLNALSTASIFKVKF